MKVLITTDLYAVATNGVVTSVKNLTRALGDLGHEVRILSFSDTEKSRREGRAYLMGSVSLNRIYPQLRMPRSGSHPYVKELIAWKPDIIHSQCEFFSFSFAKKISGAAGAPIVHTYHALYEQYVPYLIPSQVIGEWMVRKFTRLRLRRVVRIIAPTRKVERVLRKYGCNNPISVVPSGICMPGLQEREEHRSLIRQRLGISKDQTVLLNLGRLGKEKNIEELLFLASLAMEENSRVVLLIVGDGPCREELEASARQLGLGERVIFTGMVAPETVGDYYGAADIFVCASTSETQGLTYIEAAANGLPLLCRRDDCLEGVLLPGENGFSMTRRSDSWMAWSA